MSLILKRNYFEKQTEGLFEIKEDEKLIFKCYILERPWLNNQKNTSCIPEGIYKVKKEVHKKYGKVLRFFNVPNRAGVLMHPGNYVSHSKGCLLPGEMFIDINNDRLRDVINSRNTMNKIYDILPNESLITIKS